MSLIIFLKKESFMFFRSLRLSKNVASSTLSKPNHIQTNYKQLSSHTGKDEAHLRHRSSYFYPKFHYVRSLSEIYREFVGSEKYIKQPEKYDSLSETDKAMLNQILFTDTGYYALSQNYITVDQFLSLPLGARKLLQTFFYNPNEEYLKSLEFRKIDCIFKNNFLDLDQFSSFSNEKREILISFLNLPDLLGMKAINQCLFTIYHFLAFTEEQEIELIGIFRSHHSGIHRLNDEKLMNQINSKLVELRNKQEEKKSSFHI